MRESDIDKRFEQQDRDSKLYTDMKIRSVKKLLAPFFWMAKYPKKALLILFVFVLICISVASSIDLKKFITNKFGIELKQ